VICARSRESFGPKLRQFALGQDDRPLELATTSKASAAKKLPARYRRIAEYCGPVLREQAADIAARLKRRRLGAHTVQVKVRYGDFTTMTRQISVEEPVAEAKDIYRLGCFLLGRDRLVSRPCDYSDWAWQVCVSPAASKTGTVMKEGRFPKQIGDSFF